MKRLKIVAVLLAIITFPGMPKNLYGWLCGDANGNGFLELCDASHMMNYLFTGGPAPEEPLLAEMDYHEGITIMDPAMIYHTWLTCDLFDPPCPPSYPPLAPTLNENIKIFHVAQIPAEVSDFALTLTLASPLEDTYVLCLPIKIRIGSEVPMIDSVCFPGSESNFVSEISRVYVNQESGILAFGGQAYMFSLADEDLFATIYISVEPHPIARPITIEMTKLVPQESPTQDSTIFPLVGGYCMQFIHEPVLIAYICGDANGDETVNVSDVVHLINYVFAEGDAPFPLESGNANCDDSVNISDAVHIVNYIFLGSAPPCDCK